MRIIECRAGQSIMQAAAEEGLIIHADSPTPGRSIEGAERWAAEHNIRPAALVMVRRGECFVAVSPASILGRRGGLKGGKATGARKRRGDSAYYRSLQAKRPRTYAATLNGKATRVTIPED